MFFAHRTTQRIKTLFAILVVYTALVAVLALVFPREDANFWQAYGQWLVALPVGIIVYVALELFCTWALGLPFWQRLPSWVRVPLLVVSIVIGVFLFFYFGNPRFTVSLAQVLNA
jgi:hypothetical protein